jgi:hypothetical protein
MATRTASVAEVKGFGEYAHVITWEGLLNGDVGSAIEMPGSHIRSVQIVGTFGVGGTVVIQGSNDGTNYVTLTDPQANNLSKTAAALESIQELTRYIRPEVTGGDGTTDLKVYLLVKRVH